MISALSPTPFLSRRRLLQAGLTATAGLWAGRYLVAQNSPTASDSAAAGSSGGPDLQGAGFYRTRVGGLKVTVIADGSLTLAPAHPAFGGAAATAAEVDAALAAAFLPTGGVEAALNCLVVETGREVLLVDTGYGPGGRQSTSGRLRAHLARAGYAPEDISRVAITHAHGDHIFGLLEPDNRLAFPRAKVFLTRPEYDFWKRDAAGLAAVEKDPNLARLAGAFKGLQPLLETLRPQLELVAPDGELAPGVRYLSLPGHTPGHAGVRVEDAGETLVHTGDFANHPVLYFQHPEWHFGFDTDFAATVATRRRFLDQAAREKQRILGYHFPFPGIGRVAREADAFRFVPEPWSWAG